MVDYDTLKERVAAYLKDSVDISESAWEYARTLKDLEESHAVSIERRIALERARREGILLG